MWKLSATLLAAGVVATGCSSSHTATPAKLSTSAALITVQGKVVLTQHESITENGVGTTCWANGNDPITTAVGGTASQYIDVKAGAQVVISNAAGATIGVGQLDDGIAETGQGSDKYECAFLFKVTDVPGGQQFYGVKVANEPVHQESALDATAGSTIMFGS